MITQEPNGRRAGICASIQHSIPNWWSMSILVGCAEEWLATCPVAAPAIPTTCIRRPLCTIGRWPRTN